MIHILNSLIAVRIGESEAILLQRIASFLSGKPHTLKEKKGKWVYNSLKSWKENHFPHWSMYKLRRTIKSLESKDLIKSYKANAKKWNQTKWYSINETEYSKLIKEVFPVESIKKSSTNRCDDFQQMYNITKRNYTKDTKVSSSKRSLKKNIFKKLNQEFNSKINKLIEEKINKNLSLKTNIEIDNQHKKLSEEQLEKVKEMRKVWNKVFEYSIRPIKAYVNQKNEAELYKLLMSCFNNNLEEWREYACKVNSSQFLMGEKKTKSNFKASFAWLIKEETVEKIQNGEYGVGDRELDMNNLSKNIEQKKEEIVNKMDKKVLEYIKHETDKKREKEEFARYIIKEEYKADGDKYGIEKIFQTITPYELLNYPEYKGMYQNMFDRYIMKKCVKASRLKIKKEMEEMITMHIDKENKARQLSQLNVINQNMEMGQLNSYEKLCFLR